MSEATSSYWRKILDLDGPTDENLLNSYRSKLEVLRPAYFGLIGFLCRLYCRVEVFGLENIPAEPPYIIAPNHTSVLDQTIVSYAIGSERRDKMYTLASKHFFDNPFFRTFMRIAANVVRLDREEDFFTALRTAAKLIKLGRAVYINPEGTRSKTGDLQPFKVGVGVLAVETGAPIIPVYIEGTFKSLKRGNIIPKPHKVKVFFGEPILMDGYKKRLASEPAYDVYRSVTEELFKRVSSLKVG